MANRESKEKVCSPLLNLNQLRSGPGESTDVCRSRLGVIFLRRYHVVPALNAECCSTCEVAFFQITGQSQFEPCPSG